MPCEEYHAGSHPPGPGRSFLAADEDPLFVRVGYDPVPLDPDPEEFPGARKRPEEHLLDLPLYGRRNAGALHPLLEPVLLPRAADVQERQPRLLEEGDPLLDP